jgi:ADP-heptose:LPS heptosyltransferase
LLDSLDLRELIALISRAQIFVGNDSGPTHIAAALERPTVVVFGASNAEHWSPWKTPYRLIRHDASSDSPASAPRDDSPDHGDIFAVTREEVRDACISLLEEIRSRATER